MLLKSPQELTQWRAVRWHVSVATGCFDVLHVGHVRLLEEAKRIGAFLLVGINSDASVRVLKGESRPVNNEIDRAEMLLALRCVDAVYIFGEIRATSFLTMARPETWVKGGDYTLETLDQTERQAVESCGGGIRFFRTVKGYSTTETLARQNAPLVAYADGVR